MVPPARGVAAVLTASPVTSVVPVSGSPATTSPVLTPVRKRIGDPALGLELGVERRQRVADLPGGPHGAQGIVLVDHRDPEHRHHGVADELLDGPAVALDHAAHHGEVAGHQGPERFGVQLLAQGRRPGHVGEQDRDQLADLARRRRAVGLPDTALGAELRPGRDVRAAVGTCDRHRRSLGSRCGRLHGLRAVATAGVALSTIATVDFYHGSTDDSGPNAQPQEPRGVPARERAGGRDRRVDDRGGSPQPRGAPGPGDRSRTMRA